MLGIGLCLMKHAREHAAGKTIVMCRSYTLCRLAEGKNGDTAGCVLLCLLNKMLMEARGGPTGD